MNTVIKPTKVKVFKDDTKQAIKELTRGMMEVNAFYNLEVMEDRKSNRMNIISIG